MFSLEDQGIRSRNIYNKQQGMRNIYVVILGKLLTEEAFSSSHINSGKLALCAWEAF